MFILFCVHVVVYVEVRGRPVALNSLLVLYGFWRLSSGLQTQVTGGAFTHWAASRASFREGKGLSWKWWRTWHSGWYICFCFKQVSVECLYSHLSSLWLGIVESLCWVMVSMLISRQHSLWCERVNDALYLFLGIPQCVEIQGLRLGVAWLARSLPCTDSLPIPCLHEHHWHTPKKPAVDYVLRHVTPFSVREPCAGGSVTWKLTLCNLSCKGSEQLTLCRLCVWFWSQPLSSVAIIEAALHRTRSSMTMFK